MEEGRRQKARSVAIEPQGTPRPKTKRPELSERHNSAPSVNRKRDSHNKRVSAGTKSSDVSQRSSKASSWGDLGPNRRSDQSRNSQGATRRGSQAEGTDDITTLTIVVTGATGVGKSSFIRNALDLRKCPSNALSSSKVSLNGAIYRVQLLELSLDDIQLRSGQRVRWPRDLISATVPSIDGVFCLYDVTDDDSVNAIQPTLAAITNSEIPWILVACKTDIPESQWQINPDFHEQVRHSFANASIAETSEDAPESQKRCISSILNRIFAAPRKGPGHSNSGVSTSPNKNRAAHEVSSEQTSPEHSRSRSRSHSRLRLSKSKEILLNLASRPPLIESSDEQNHDDLLPDEVAASRKMKLRVDTSGFASLQHRPAEPHTPVSPGGNPTSQLLSPSEGSKAMVPDTPESYYVKSMLRPNSSDTADSRAFQTFLNMDEEPHDEAVKGTGSSKLTPTQNLKPDLAVRLESGVSFEELIDRLLLLPMSKHDSKFVPSFLCLYRCFATPKQLLVAIIDRFMKTEKSNLVHFTKVAEMLRYLQVLAQWTALYPGDFARMPARNIATAFIQSIEKIKSFAPAAREISNNLETIVPDDDIDWGIENSAHDSTSRDTKAVSQRLSGPQSNSTPPLNGNENVKATSSARNSHHDHNNSEDDNDGTSSSPFDSGVASTASSALRTGNASSQSFSNLLQLQTARQQADRLRPNPHIRLTKNQWHQFMDTPVEELAREITRIDWIMYSSIRPRDFVRHITLTSEQKKRSRNIDNISTMVRQFNHLALFVSGMILLRDKPKHRARALEKFMALAWKVRQLNNYNSLGAIVAGITGHEIARLTATRDLVPPDIQKQFLRLTILMGLSRSHAAYRMAWDNSFQERIPFLPLLRQDLTMASSANPTFIGKNINWKKFEIMGDVIVGIQKSLEQPYSFPQRSMRSDEIIKLILESRILEESEDSADPRSELYERSVQVEPQAGADAKKKFEWLRR